MKKLLLLAFLAGSVSLGYAQTKPEANDLKLSEQQGQKLKDINKSFLSSSQDIRKNDALSKEEKKAKLEALQADRTGQIKSVLDASQFEQWQKNQSANKEKMASIMEKRKGKEGRKGATRMKDHGHSDAAIKELGLTEKQGEELKSINQEYAAKAKELKDQTDLSKEQKMEQVKALKAERSAKLKASLGDARYEKYEALRKDAKRGKRKATK